MSEEAELLHVAISRDTDIGGLDTYPDDIWFSAIKIEDAAAASAPLESSAPQILLRTHPVPFGQKVTLSYELPSSANVSLRVFDTQGRLVEVLQEDRSGRVLPSGRRWRRATGNVH